MEDEGGSLIGRILWYGLAVPFLWLLGRVLGDHDLGSPD